MRTNSQHREYELNRYHARRKMGLELLGGACVICGSQDKLEFHHRDPSDKSFALSKSWSVCEEDFIAEIQKCQLLCHLHHNKIHSARIHGTYNMYKRGKCRCKPCRKANSDYMAKYRLTHTRKD